MEEVGVFNPSGMLLFPRGGRGRLSRFCADVDP